ncbi:MAG: hypothetical protein A2096_01210 [Spirochaetes bacterium GWF1_41_5]|nr:MAG: hypothetical protein A2096_01210 [Spirochaetes bacterium GWF1_41_5]HBE04690.1 hypothetical protein [Spirochaetia bacterium]
MQINIELENLVKNIHSAAEEEAAGIITAAENAALNRRRSAEEQAGRIFKDAEKKTEQQTAAINKNNDSRTKTAVRRIGLTSQEKIIRLLLTEAKNRLLQEKSSEEYKSVICGWISEAIVGLGEKEAFLHAGSYEKNIIDETILRQAQNNARNNGYECQVKISAESANFKEAGIMLSASNNTAYTNSIETRLQRFEQQIRKIIFEEVFNA